MSNVKSYIVNSRLRHSGRLYESGDTVLLTQKQADALLPINVVKLNPDQSTADVANTGGGVVVVNNLGNSNAGETPVPPTDDNGQAADTPPADDDLGPGLKIPEIKEKLDAAGIKYPSGANKATLLALLPVGA